MTIKSKVKFQPTYLEISDRRKKGVVSVSAALWDMRSTGPRVHNAACDILEDSGIFLFTNTGRLADSDPKVKGKLVEPYTFDDGQPDLNWLVNLLDFCQTYDAAIEIDKALMLSYGRSAMYFSDASGFKPSDKFCIRAINTYIEYLYNSCIKKGVRFTVLPYDNSIYDQNSLGSALSASEKATIDLETLVAIPGTHLWVPTWND